MSSTAQPRLELDGFDADDDFTSPAAPASSWVETRTGEEAFGFPDETPASAAMSEIETEAYALTILKPFDAALDEAEAAEVAVEPAVEMEVPRTNPFAGLPGVGETVPVARDEDATPFNPVGSLMGQVESAMGETPVPRIAIHVFAQRPDTAAVAEKAAGDRRLARATTLVRPGGLADALAFYRTTPTPSLLMIESLDPAETLLAGLDRLAEVCDPGTKVVIIGSANDIALYRELMRRGVSEYLTPPLSPLQLIRTISGLYADPATPFVGRTLAFVGAKGGVGASSIAHNFAWALSEHVQANTCIVDYDLPFGTAALDFNQDPIQGIADALSKPDRLDPVLMDRMTARCTDRLSLFAAPANLDDDFDIAASAYEEVGRKIRSTAPYVVLDLPHVWSGWMRHTLLSSDDVVIVATPDLASLRNGKNLIDLIKRGRPTTRRRTWWSIRWACRAVRRSR